MLSIIIDIVGSAQEVVIDEITGTPDIELLISNAKGDKGDPGIGIPAGGTTGQVLKKTSNSDYATAWQNEASGAGVNTYIQDTDPAPAGVNYAWWQTSGGNLVTLWININ